MTPWTGRPPLTILLAAACAVFLLRGWVRPFFSRLAASCGGCHSCADPASQEEPGESRLVQIDGAPPPERGDRSPG